MESVADYLNQIPEDRKESFNKLRQIILDNIPKGFQECISYGMIGYVVPHATYPSGYHCNPKLPLPFLSIASQKNFVSIYHMGIYANSEIYDWFVEEFSKHSKQKLDMGKSCIRFKKPSEIPFELIAQLVKKITVDNWVKLYESKLK
jgi:uncharacterized protein YdhG (YjbR/CyaY superfamily)